MGIIRRDGICTHGTENAQTCDICRLLEAARPPGPTRYAMVMHSLWDFKRDKSAGFYTQVLGSGASAGPRPLGKTDASGRTYYEGVIPQTPGAAREFLEDEYLATGSRVVSVRFQEWAPHQGYSIAMEHVWTRDPYAGFK